MNTELALFRRNDSQLSVDVADEAEQFKQTVLAQSALIGKVSNDAENQIAVDAQSALQGLIELIERSRKEVKDPVLRLTQRIDGTAKQFAGEIVEEITRISRLTGDYAALLLARKRAQDVQLMEAVEKTEREKQAALAQAKTHEQREDIQARFNAEAAAQPMPILQPADGQRIEEDWDFEVASPALLWSHYPHCIKWEPAKREIKALLRVNGGKLPGVQAWTIVKSRVKKALPTVPATGNATGNDHLV